MAVIRRRKENKRRIETKLPYSWKVLLEESFVGRKFRSNR